MFSGCKDDGPAKGGQGGEGGEGTWGVGGSGVGSTSSGSMGGDGEPAVMNGMTAAHNEARANANPAPAKPMPPLTWSADLAAVAQAYAEKCIWEHSSNNYGENLYATSGGDTPQDVVNAWVSEVQYYDYASDSCSDVCGHYTQVVWAETLRLGCGMAKCPDNAPWGNGPWEMWVCNYDPPGNWVGQKPY
ncbi:MAG: Fis family transcriptional regulator [Polyangiaceae bacterium]|nr:Fis family transcriptional regulator [Polyangiaceae bacterium]